MLRTLSTILFTTLAATSMSVMAHTGPTTQPEPLVVAPAPGETVRVGGDLFAKISGTDGDFRAGVCHIDTPLPSEYPAPTPPKAIDIKTYPVVRLAQVKGVGNPDRGRNDTFWPLFNHIKKHNIAMTSPVEMSYTNLTSDPRSEPDSWSMAFLYRNRDMNQVGQEGTVTVADVPPITVVSLGMKGDYNMNAARNGMKEIEQWLQKNPQWQPAGEWRTLYYNGPTLLFWNKWSEVQLPVRQAR